MYPTDAGLTTNSGCAFELTDIETGACAGRFADYINMPVVRHGCRIFRAKVVAK